MSKPSQIRSAANQERFVNALFYGFPGIGKTRLLGSSTGKVLVLECGKSETDTCVAAGQDVDVWEIHKRSELDEAYEYLRHEGYNDYKWAWVDGLSPLEGRLMKEQLRTQHAANTNRSDLVPAPDDYLKIQSIMDKFVTDMVDLPMNVGFTAHVMMEEVTLIDEDGDESQVLMMLPQIQGGHGKLSQKICAYMNIVGYMDTLDGKDGKQRAMLVRFDGRHVAKDRFNCLANENGWLFIPDDKPFMPTIEAKVSRALGKGPKKATGVKKVAKKATKSTKKTAQPARKAAGLRAKK